MEHQASNLHELVSNVILDTKGSAEGLFTFAADSSIALFLPETILCLTILAILFIRLFRLGERFDMVYVAIAGLGAGLFAIAPWRLGEPAFLVSSREIFTGLLVYDSFSVFLRGLLFGFAILFVIFTKISGTPNRHDSADIYTLILGATLGLCLMSTANHLLIVFMGIEMASVPSYALAAIHKRDRHGTEAALKFAVFGAGAAGIMLYGISLLAGLFQTVHLPTLAVRMSTLLPGMGTGELMVATLAGLMVMVGLAYKLSAFPFHYWAPDVFEGAPAEIGAFLSVASKAAALALLVRLVVGIGTTDRTFDLAAGAPENGSVEASQDDETSAAVDSGDTTFVSVARNETSSPSSSSSHEPPTHEHAAHEHAPHGDAKGHRAPDQSKEGDTPAIEGDGLGAARSFMAKLIALIAVVTCTFGNLAAYGQRNIKRMLAYSTIAHAGFMMMAVPGLLAAAPVDRSVAESAISGLSIYLAIYVFMNLGAFATVAFLRNAMGSEEIDDYAGLLQRTPLVAICFAMILFSLVGIPPFAGFIGKLAVLASLVDAFRVTGESYLMGVAVIGVLNTAIALIYYLRVARVMTMSPEPESRPPFSMSPIAPASVYIVLITLPNAFLIVAWDGLHRITQAASHMF